MSGTADGHHRDGYHLGVDLGTTYTAAAVSRDGQVRTVGLGNRAAVVPSVLYVGDDGSVLVGEAATRRAVTEPDRVAREFKRRIGDATPVLLGGVGYTAENLTARLLRAVVEKVAEMEGGPPDGLVVTHPANWGAYKRDMLARSVELAGLHGTLLSEPEAAAIAYAANERIEPGSLVAVYDLGGGTFDVAVLRKHADGFAFVGRPEGIERLGGVDFDEAVVGHVRDAVDGALERVDPADPAALAALVRLRRECVEAKEALSTDTGTSIPVLLPDVQTEVRLTRAEFEAEIRPALAATIDVMHRALKSADVDAHDVTSVLLVGGSSRIPLVAELVADAFGRPVAVDAHPKHVVALGAARAAALATAPRFDEITAPLRALRPDAPGADRSSTATDDATSEIIGGREGRTDRSRHRTTPAADDRALGSDRGTGGRRRVAPGLRAVTHHSAEAGVDPHGAADAAGTDQTATLPSFAVHRRRRRSVKTAVQIGAVLVLALFAVGAGAWVNTNEDPDARVGTGAGALETPTDQPAPSEVDDALDPLADMPTRGPGDEPAGDPRGADGPEGSDTANPDSGGSGSAGGAPDGDDAGAGDPGTSADNVPGPVAPPGPGGSGDGSDDGSGSGSGDGSGGGSSPGDGGGGASEPPGGGASEPPGGGASEPPGEGASEPPGGVSEGGSESEGPLVTQQPSAPAPAPSDATLGSQQLGT